MRTDTIVAVATAPGRAAVSIVRVSGADAERIVRQVVTPWPEVPRVMTRCRVHAPHAAGHAPIDDALVVHFPGPQSYTGETVVEVHGHGGTFVCQAIAGALLAAGARAASPGEFTERAVLNGKLDLVRAEAIEELIDARTRAAHRLAMQGVSGVRSHEFNALRESAIGLEALLAFDIDFPEEDQGALARERIDAAATELLERLAALTRTSRMASVARDGASVVLAGPPNAGKSSLMNALVGEARVIVSDEPGTTRDAVEVLLDGDRWPVRLVDTAGLRSDPGPVERLGIEVSERYLRGADVVLVCAESVDALDAMQDRLVALTGAILIPVSTKSDLTRATPGTSALSVSARTGEGIAELRIAIERAVSERFGSSDAETLVAGSARQAAALTVAHREISDFLIAWREGGLPAPVVATHLRAATTALDEIIGVVDIDDVFSRVFSTFCIGK